MILSSNDQAFTEAFAKALSENKDRLTEQLQSQLRDTAHSGDPCNCFLCQASRDHPISNMRRIDGPVPGLCKHGMKISTCAICCGSARTRKHKVKSAPIKKPRKHAAPPAWHEDARAEIPSEQEMHLHYIASLYDTVSDARDDFNAMLANYRAEYRERFMDCCEFLGLV